MAIVPFAKWEPVPSHSGNLSAHQGLILHVQVGNGDCYGEFANPANQASSHWWVAKDGTLVQYVDSDLIAWTESAGNPYWNSVETEGLPSESLTNPQVLTLARLYVWGHQTYNWPLKNAETPSDTGFGWHGMGGTAWGGHTGCPGDLRKAQRAGILYLAGLVINPPAPTPSKKVSNNMATAVPTGGQLAIRPDGGVFSFNGARFYGSMPGLKITKNNIVGIASTKTGNGYWLVGSDGGVFSFGDAGYHGSGTGNPGWGIGTASNPVVAIVRDDTKQNGYILIADNGTGAPAEYACNEINHYA